MTREEKLIELFNEIRSRGWIETKRYGDQCLGNTFEDLIGKPEDNKSQADYYGIELKSHRSITKSMVTLFSKCPSYPKGVNTHLRETYGVFENQYDKKVLNTTVSGDEENTHRGGHCFKITVDRVQERLYLQIRSMESGEIINDEIYWSFSVLKRAIEKKIKTIAVLYGDEKIENGKRYVRYTSMKILHGISLENLVDSIERGNLKIDIRIGVYASGKNIGKTHDHGTAFRINLTDLLDIYGTVCEY